LRKHSAYIPAQAGIKKSSRRGYRTAEERKKREKAFMNRTTSPLDFAPLFASGLPPPATKWSTDQSYGKNRTRLCFANPSHETIRCRRGLPMSNAARA
jgi:hypothetical protein